MPVVSFRASQTGFGNNACERSAPRSMKNNYDVVIAGGGLAGAAFALRLAPRFQVLVVERERKFKDRVRGETLMPWGVAEAKKLGIYQTLLAEARSHEVALWRVTLSGAPFPERDLVATTPEHTPCLCYYHPAMQEALFQAAAQAGAEVLRGAVVRKVAAGAPPTVTIESDGIVSELAPRLVVAADGRGSSIRQAAGFEVRRDPENLRIAGLLLELPAAPQDGCDVVMDPASGRAAILLPQGGARARAYNVYPHDSSPVFGDDSVARFLSDLAEIGMPRKFLANAQSAGPAAIFDGADRWVDHPYRQGVALIGDAAATSDPSWGQGMSLSLRDARVLADALLANSDADVACHAYAAEHDRYYGVIHTLDNLTSRLFLARGPAADAHRLKFLPLIAADPTFMPDHQFGGPDLPRNEEAFRLLAGN